MADQYYAEEITAVPFGTMRKSLATAVPDPVAFVLAGFFRMRGLLGWPMKPTYAVGGVGSEQVVEPDALPPRAISRWAPIIEQLRDLGFSPIKYSIADVIGQKQQASILFLDEPGRTIATLEWIRMPGGEGIAEKAPLEFNSYAKDDPEIMTGFVPKEDLALAGMLTLDFVDSSLFPNHLPLADVYHRHLARIEGRLFHQMSPEEALPEHRKRSERRFNWALEQGLLRPLAPAEISRLREMDLK